MVTNNSCDYQPTQYNVQTGGANGTLNNVSPSSTSGVPFISQGASSQPIFGTAVVAGGGTAVTSWTDTNSLLCTGTSSTGAIQDVASVATGQVLISAGTSTLPSWSATPGVTSITLGGGSVLDAYVVGTFTPGIAFGGSSTGITYTVNSGNYTRIGNVVYATYFITLSNKGSATGNATLTGLPINASGTTRAFIANTNNFTYIATYTNAELLISNGSSTASIQQFTAVANVANATNTNFANNTSLVGQLFYFV